MSLRTTYVPLFPLLKFDFRAKGTVVQDTTQPENPVENPSQLDLDEQLARQLQLEDEQAHQRARGQSWQPRRRGSDPNQAQAAPAQAQGQNQGQGAASPDFQEIKETLNQMAESTCAVPSLTILCADLVSPRWKAHVQLHSVSCEGKDQ